MRKINRIILHYSATYDDMDIGVAEIDKMHRDRGWKGVGYHYVIRLNGRIEKGRDEAEIGAHVSGHNVDSIGICCVGGTRRATGPSKGFDTRTDAQKAATVRLVKDLLTRYPNAKVLGHRDLAPTQCPGFDARAWWAAVDQPAPAPLPPATTRPQGSFLAAFFAALTKLFKRG